LGLGSWLLSFVLRDGGLALDRWTSASGTTAWDFVRSGRISGVPAPEERGFEEAEESLGIFLPGSGLFMVIVDSDDQDAVLSAAGLVFAVIGLRCCLWVPGGPRRRVSVALLFLMLPDPTASSTVRAAPRVVSATGCET